VTVEPVPAPAPGAGRLATALGRSTALGRVADAVHGRLEPALGPTALGEQLRGRSLGHRMHPMLTDLPIGSWTSAWVLDLVGGERAEPAADLLVAIGVATAAPTALAGWADWVVLPPAERRIGVVHAGSNGIATALYAASLVARRTDRRGVGVALGHAGAAVATVGGYLGGHLAFVSLPRSDVPRSEAGEVTPPG
jgi:uncharacterized membrane protein